MATRLDAAIIGTAVWAAALLLFPSARGLSQTPQNDPATAAASAALARANLEAGGGVLTLFDRQGNVVGTVGERGFYGQQSLSPDGMRLLVNRRDETTSNIDIWMFEISTGASTRITSDPAVDNWPVWSSDGSEIFYASNTGGFIGLYRRAVSGTGTAELLYKSVANLWVTDSSPDGQHLTFYDASNLYVLTLSSGTSAEGTATVLPGETLGRGGRFSPDGRFLAYVSNRSGRSEIWVRATDSARLTGAAPQDPWQVSRQGGAGMVFWREDGRELYYLSADRNVMAVEVSTAGAFSSGEPRALFKAPEFISGTISGTSVSRDGQQFLFNVLPKPRGTPLPRQLTVLDRQGTVVRTVGEPEVGYNEPSLSPDGTRVAVTRNERIQVFDLSRDTSTPITASTIIVRYQGAPVWSQDGRRLVSFSQREASSGLYRQSSDGSGIDELLHKDEFEICLPVTDWSQDGRFLAFGGGGVIWTMPVNGERPASELLRDEYRAMGARFSPDSRYIAYASDESDRYEVYVRPFDASTGSVGDEKWQISTQGGLNLIQWRGDGRELIYLAPDGTMMAVNVTTTPTFSAGRQTPLFRAPAPVRGLLDVATPLGDPTACGEADAGCGLDQMGSISRDGQRFAFDVPVPPPAVTLTRSVLERYVGTWRQPAGGTRTVGNTVVVTTKDNQLMVQTTLPRDPLFALFAASETTFFRMRGDEYEFVADDTGDVKYLFVYDGAAPVQLIRQ